MHADIHKHHNYVGLPALSLHCQQCSTPPKNAEMITTVTSQKILS